MKTTTYATVIVFLGLFAAAASASAPPATWSSFTATTAIGSFGGVTINASTSSGAPFIGIFDNHFGPNNGVCGSWDGNMPLSHSDGGIVASNVNAGDYQTFTFSSPLTDGLFYIENFDSSSVANITALGATSLSLVDNSPSISFASTGADSGTLTTSNAGFDGEGDAVIQFTGEVTAIQISYTSGEGANGVFYTFAEPSAVPEPTSALVMAGLFSLGGIFVHFKRRKLG